MTASVRMLPASARELELEQVDIVITHSLTHSLTQPINQSIKNLVMDMVAAYRTYVDPTRALDDVANCQLRAANELCACNRNAMLEYEVLIDESQRRVSMRNHTGIHRRNFQQVYIITCR